ncbi:murein L,D-transpeptidase catalytic domain family protein [Flavobacterium paronense]|uniref:Murein L,D-transpeptidase catalytic domain family protein n=1 Tax=Flavobacterium paronense TaxID=1392775 RepID=A0ABV5GE84_9FLAO|nr:murein L,D-transpeptidase catalytic domain family protein [Flavobacterium paronense]MDN3675846.1 murein L,D-transpeptidase catalytic domain family protein [Flavobacterium paronense]MDN3676192.1 murein L,D-transpeptidase catalytic domain family protein [Flavobacterium paronense]
MNYKSFSLFFVVLFMSFTNLPSKTNSIKTSIKTETTAVSKNVSVYNQLDANSFVLPSFDCFNLALDGFHLLKEKGLVQKNVLTLVDFSLSSNMKRLWVIDLDRNMILFNTLVAHGRNTGEEFAAQFSNQAESFKSSIGFYATGEIYDGKHGLSLKLDGLEKGLNDKARERAVVVHGADYVSESFIKQNKRLGRSQGCPAIPVEMNAKIINVIKNKSCLFIYHPSATHEIISRLTA